MQSRLNAKFILTALLAASGMAAAQTTTPAPTTDQAQTAPNAQAADPNAPPIEAPVAGGPSASPKKTASEEIIVTGTRVRRKDLNTPAPVTVVTRDQLQASGRVSVGDFLQSLPEQGNTVNAQVNNGNDGSVRVSLRSLGSNRTLVLVNGRRMVPGGTGADSSADLNTIPNAAIERIEVLKDGASAIYGSDAIAGVVNVILRKRYSGTEVGGYAGISQPYGDARTYDVHAVSGTAGDKGSVLFSIGLQDQQQALAGSRRWSESTYFYDFDPTSDTYGQRIASGNSSTWPQGRFSLPSKTSNCAGATPGTPLGTICSLSGNNFEPNGPNSWIAYPGNAYNTNPTNYLITPGRRVQLFSTGDANLGSEARAFFEASYVNRYSQQNLAPMPIVSTTIPTNPVSISRDSIYNPFGVDIASWRRRSVEFGNRLFTQNVDTFRVVVGLDGALGDWAGPATGWTWNVDYNHGRTAGTYRHEGEISMSRLANALGPSMIDPATGKPACVRVANQISTRIGGCVPMDVLHGVGTLDATAKNYVAFDGQDWGHDQQDIWSANISGDLIRLLGDRPVGLALGVDYRRESASYLPNPVTAGLDSSGNNGLPTQGGYNVKEAYGELVVPLLSRMPGVEDLELQGAVRFNNFSTFGNETTYKLGARWSPIRDLVVRGTYGTAYRAPTVAELYGGASDTYPAVRDPCNNPANATIRARCVGAGVPNNGNSGDPSTQFLAKNVANATLGPETAKILTAGIVIQPQMIRALSLTLDYYNISVEKTITTRGSAFILAQCFTAPTSNPAMCNLILRDSAGAIILINDERANVGAYHTTGFDFALRYDLPVENYGRFNFIVDGTLLRSFRFTDELGVVTNGYDDYALIVDPSGSHNALPKLKLNTGVFWSFGGFGAGVSARYVGSYNECVDVDGSSSPCNLDSSGGQRRVSSYLPFDVFLSYTLRNWTAGTTQLVIGANNVANTSPPFIATAFAANSDPGTYDYLGRFFYTRLTHNF
jgi:iron complex outermembrane recepter protein